MGVVSHQGDLVSGHYVAMVKGFNDKFYSFDDMLVNNRESLRNGWVKRFSPYIIFYRKTDKENLENCTPMMVSEEYDSDRPISNRQSGNSRAVISNGVHSYGTGANANGGLKDIRRHSSKKFTGNSKAVISNGVRS
ncbi:hypothetical protein COOONC_05837, partial [Cooperia oncophora]